MRRRGGVDADVVDADVVYTDEDTAESVELKPEVVDGVDDEVVEVFFSELPTQSGVPRRMLSP
jgi:hypothetical protein